jgi:hypothetical protein
VFGPRFAAWSGSTKHARFATLALCVLGVGYFGAIALGFAGLKRRGMLPIARVLFTIPLYWLFMSMVAWRALVQLIRAPYKWEKTEHGLARSSLRAERRQVSTLPPVRNFVARNRADRSQRVVDASPDRL